MKKREFDLALLYAYPIIASLITLALKTNVFISIIIFLVVPAIFLSIRQPSHIVKAASFSLILGTPFIIMIYYIGHVTNAWLMPSVFPLVFRFVNIEVILWLVFWIYFTVLFYENFFDKHVKVKRWHPHMKYLIMLAFSLFSIFLLFVYSASSLLESIPYSYLFIGIVVVITPTLLFLFNSPALFVKFLKTQVYFFYFNLIYELNGLALGWWTFPGTEFIGWISLFGLTFPIEELLFWIVIGAMAILSYYKFFDDS